MMATPRERAKSGVRDTVRSAIHLDLPGVGLVVACDDLDECGLAGSVLPEQRERGAAGGVKVHAVEDLNATE